MKKTWKIGTRGSKLALKQTEIVVEKLKEIYLHVECIIRVIRTTGDTVWDKPFQLIGGKGLFVKEIEDALLKNEIDMAVHSMKDMPSELENELVIGAVLEREDPRDVFISTSYKSIHDIKEDSCIGTGSSRRKSQLLFFKKNLKIVPMRGNVDTRIKKLNTQNLDGIVLAYAGIKRMGFQHLINELIPFEIMVPPSGQGVIGIETRKEIDCMEFVKPLNHENTFHEIMLERELQSIIGGGCQVPLGINASITNDVLTLHVFLGDENGMVIIKDAYVERLENKDVLLKQIVSIIEKKMPSA